MKFAQTGTAPEQLFQEMTELQKNDANWRDGKLFSLVYYMDDKLRDVLLRAHEMFFYANGLSPTAFPSLRRFETEVLQMVAELFHGETAVGSMTTGGSESVLMAVKTARDFSLAKNPTLFADGRRPHVVLPTTAHPAFAKAADYFGLEQSWIEVGADFRVNVAAMEAAINERTILLVGSATNYPHGTMDPIEDIAALAQRRGLLCHVDACLGGFCLPFLEKAGRPIPKWDFRLPGVTSISADLHKYGYSARGASTVLYRDRALRRHQFFSYPNYPGGLYGSPTMTGSRAGGPIAAAWAAMKYLGRDGYERAATQAMATADRFRAAIEATPGLRVLGDPLVPSLSFTSDSIDILQVCDAMHERGWEVQRQQRPPSAHLLITPNHAGQVEAFVQDLRAVTKSLEGTGPADSGAAAMYGMLGATPDRGAVKDFILDFLDGLDAV